MKKKLTAFILISTLILTLVMPQMAIAETPDNAGETPSITNGWDAGKTHYYKNGQMVTGLIKISGSYYYFNEKTGVILKNTMKSVVSGKKKYVYYFGKNGAAYKAPADKYTVNCKVYKIGNRYYGFDQNSHRVTGVWAATNGKAWVFEKSVAKINKSKKLRKVTKMGKTGKKLITEVRKIMGKPSKTKVSKNSCNYFDNDSRAKYWDYTLRYKNVDVELTKNTRTGVYYMNGIYGRSK